MRELDVIIEHWWRFTEPEDGKQIYQEDKPTITTKNGQRLTKTEAHLIDKAKCPDCKGGLLEGPHGGLSVNLYCANQEECGSRFNLMGPFGVERITDRQPTKAKS